MVRNTVKKIDNLDIRPLSVENEALFLKYSQLSLRRTHLGSALSVRLIESQIKGVKKGRDQL